MGILDSKTRLLDTVLTLEGRRQLASGQMRIQFVSFTDAEAFYQGDVASGSTDPSDRLYLEACDLPHDQVTFEADDAGCLMPFRGSQLDAQDGKVLSGSSDAFLQLITGSAFASTAETFLGSAIDSFNRLYAIRTDDALSDDEREFQVSADVVEFNITSTSPFTSRQVSETTVEHIESLFQDKRLSRASNFAYLPPVNAPSAPGVPVTPLGLFPPIGQRRTPMTYAELQRDMQGKDQRVVEFSTTSLRSNIACQVFELKQDSMLKLDAIDFGEVTTGDPSVPAKRVFFVGKLLIDSLGAQTFVSIMTLVFE